MMPDWADARDLRSLSTRFRARRDHGLRAFIQSCRGDRPGIFRILDLGGTVDYWRRVGLDWLAANQIEITCVNHVATEFGGQGAVSDRIHSIVGDACDMVGHEDGSYDLVHSNSVVEHVGRWPEMRKFANEVRRLAPSYYVQTPYFWFPVDPHFYRMPFYHWLPESIRLKLLQRFRLGYSRPTRDIDRAMAMVLSNVLLDRQQFRALFPCGTHGFEWIAGLPKSMIVCRSRKQADLP